MGNALVKQGLFEDSIGYYHGLKENPHDAMVYNNLGNIFAMKGDLAQAWDHYRRAALMDSAAGEPYFYPGNLAVRQNQLDQAIDDFRQALTRDPNHLPAHYNLGRILAAQGKLDKR